MDTRADVWSVGAVLHERLTAHTPFRQAPLLESCTAVLRDPPRPPRALRRDAPEQLERLVLRCREETA